MNSLSPDLWGRHLWDILHWVSFKYESNDIILQNIIIIHIPNLIPCNSCKKNYLNHLKMYPPDFRSKKLLSEWMVKIHNQTNKILGKKIYSYEKIKPKYSYMAKTRVKRSFLKWSNVMRHYTNNSSHTVQRSYSEFMIYLFKNNL